MEETKALEKNGKWNVIELQKEKTYLAPKATRIGD